MGLLYSIVGRGKSMGVKSDSRNRDATVVISTTDPVTLAVDTTYLIIVDGPVTLTLPNITPQISGRKVTVLNYGTAMLSFQSSGDAISGPGGDIVAELVQAASGTYEFSAIPTESYGVWACSSAANNKRSLEVVFCLPGNLPDVDYTTVGVNNDRLLLTPAASPVGSNELVLDGVTNANAGQLLFVPYDVGFFAGDPNGAERSSVNGLFLIRSFNDTFDWALEQLPINGSGGTVNYSEISVLGGDLYGGRKFTNYGAGQYVIDRPDTGVWPADSNVSEHLTGTSDPLLNSNHLNNQLLYGHINHVTTTLGDGAVEFTLECPLDPRAIIGQKFGIKVVDVTTSSDVIIKLKVPSWYQNQGLTIPWSNIEQLDHTVSESFVDSNNVDPSVQASVTIPAASAGGFYAEWILDHTLTWRLVSAKEDSGGGGGGGGSPSGSAGGELGGSYPNPTVKKVNGVAVSGTPSSGQVLTATSSSAATWQTPSGGGGGGLTLEPTTKTANFSASVNTSYKISSTSGTIIATMPDGNTEGDEIEFLGVGNGTDSLTIDPNGHVIGTATNMTTAIYSYCAYGLNIKYKYLNDGTNLRWHLVSNSVSGFFEGDGTATPNSIIITDSAVGQAGALAVQDNTLLGRFSGDGSPGIRPIDIKSFIGNRKHITSPVAITTVELSNVAELSWEIDMVCPYTFEFYLPLKINSGGSGSFGFGINFEGASTGQVSLSAMVVSNNSAVVFGSSETINEAAAVGGSQAQGSTWYAKVTGSFTPNDYGTLSLMAMASNNTGSYIHQGAWGVLHRANLY
jgi:hypothetical protein